MRILLVGGGSGGHVTPLKAISDLLKKGNRSNKLFVVSDRGFKSETAQIFSDDPDVLLSAIFAGKFRRYHSKSFIWHILHLSTLLKNIRDVFYLSFGLIQSIWLIARIRPDVVFCKGGFVCVPVGIAARLFKKRIIIHDSDTRPGLTNRFLSKWADVIATGMPTDFYPYDARKMVYTGMPVHAGYTPQTKHQQSTLKVSLGFKADQKVLLVTGGGNGAESLNELISETIGELVGDGWGIIHIAGRGKTSSLQTVQATLPAAIRPQWHIEGFVEMLPRLLAADVVIARTSASTLQECANAKKLVIGIPSPHLADQNMNAEYFASKNTIIILNEPTLTGQQLVRQINELITDTDRVSELTRNLHRHFAKPGASEQITEIILSSQRSRG